MLSLRSRSSQKGLRPHWTRRQRTKTGNNWAHSQPTLSQAMIRNSWLWPHRSTSFGLLPKSRCPKPVSIERISGQMKVRFSRTVLTSMPMSALWKYKVDKDSPSQKLLSSFPESSVFISRQSSPLKSCASFNYSPCRLPLACCQWELQVAVHSLLRWSNSLMGSNSQILLS